jgi:hypothetical protein
MSGETSGLVDRLKKTVSPLDTIWRKEIEIEPTRLAPANLKPTPKIGGFQIAFLGRMIFSCLVDADFLDTEAFYTSVDGRQIDRTCCDRRRTAGYIARARGRDGAAPRRPPAAELHRSSAAKRSRQADRERTCPVR